MARVCAPGDSRSTLPTLPHWFKLHLTSAFPFQPRAP